MGAVARETLFELVDLLAAGDAAGAFSLLEDVLDSGSDPEQLLRGLTTQLRCVCLLQQGAGARDEWAFAPDEVVRLAAQANQLAPAQVVRALDLLADAQVRIRNGGADPRLQLELVAAKLARPTLDPSRRNRPSPRGPGAPRARGSGARPCRQRLPSRPHLRPPRRPRPAEPAADLAPPTATVVAEPSGDHADRPGRRCA